MIVAFSLRVTNNDPTDQIEQAAKCVLDGFGMWPVLVQG